MNKEYLMDKVDFLIGTTIPTIAEVRSRHNDAIKTIYGNEHLEQPRIRQGIAMQAWNIVKGYRFARLGLEI